MAGRGLSTELISISDNSGEKKLRWLKFPRLKALKKPLRLCLRRKKTQIGNGVFRLIYHRRKYKEIWSMKLMRKSILRRLDRIKASTLKRQAKKNSYSEDFHAQLGLQGALSP